MSAIVKGSLSNIARKNNQSLAESFLNADVIVLLDDSGSMSVNDAPNGLTRREAADNELKKLQANYPGKIALIAFADYPLFCPNGSVMPCGGSTDMVAALKFIKVADDCGLKLVLVSDGAPNDEQETLKVAATFKTAIQTIYIGREGGRGQDFLDKLANITGGKSFKSEAPGLLGDSTELLLLSG